MGRELEKAPEAQPCRAAFELDPSHVLHYRSSIPKLCIDLLW